MELLDAFAAMLCGVLSGLGVGSGGLFLIYLTLLRGVPQLEAQGQNLLFFLCSAGASLPLHLRERPPRWGALLFLVGFGAAGAFCGSTVSALLDPTVLRRIFGGFVLLSGLLGLRSALGKKPEKAPENRSPR